MNTARSGADLTSGQPRVACASFFASAFATNAERVRGKPQPRQVIAPLIRAAFCVPWFFTSAIRGGWFGHVRTRTRRHLSANDCQAKAGLARHGKFAKSQSCSGRLGRRRCKAKARM